MAVRRPTRGQQRFSSKSRATEVSHAGCHDHELRYLLYQGFLGGKMGSLDMLGEGIGWSDWGLLLANEMLGSFLV
jgi:hypothetical protein